MKALHSTPPKTRYLAGPDAQQLMAAAETLSDRELDAMFVQAFAGS